MKTKIFVISVVIALLFASFPAASVFAAPVRDGDPTEDNSLELEWSNKTRHLRFENLFYDRIRLLPADFENKDDMARAYELVGADVKRVTPPNLLDAAAPPAEPDFRLNAYRVSMSLLRPIAPLILKIRERSGKEDW